MRPQVSSLPPAARLLARPVVPPCPRTVCGVRNYAQTTSARTGSLYSELSRPAALSLDNRRPVQKRWITQAYIQRMKDAEKEWQETAKEIRAGKKKSFVEHLEERGLLHDVVGERDHLHNLFTNKRVGMYAGIDPTGPSLHVGHMLPLMVLAWGYVWGLPVTFLLGGATSRVGDPTGRLEGRKQVHSSIRKANMASMHMQLKKLGASIEKYGEGRGWIRSKIWRRALANNNVWWNKTSFIEILRDLGAFSRIGPMLGRDTVKTRLEQGDGMSFAEFSYPLMQAWDWWVLFQKGVQVQVGGSDQYGNILFGMDAVKTISRNTADEQARNPLKNHLDRPLGLTTPLLTSPSGEKFGKSAGNAIWLDKDMTSTFELYQFFVRTPDDTVERYLKLFTFLPLPQIEELMQAQQADPPARVAQHALAFEFVELIHGRHEAESVALQHRQLFRPRSSTAEPTPLAPTPKPSNASPHSPTANFVNPQSGNKFAPQTNFANMPSIQVTLPRSLIYNQTFNKVLWSAGLVSSKSEGHRIVANKGAYVGASPGESGPMKDQLEFTPIKTWTGDKTDEFIIDGRLMFLKLGKWKFKTVNIISDEEFRERGLTAPGWSELETESGQSDEEN